MGKNRISWLLGTFAALALGDAACGGGSGGGSDGGATGGAVGDGGGVGGSGGVNAGGSPAALGGSGGATGGAGGTVAKGPLTCPPGQADFSNGMGGIADGGLRVCYQWNAPPAAITCSTVFDTTAARMACPTTAVELIAFGPVLVGTTSWRGRTRTDDPPRRIRSTSHGEIDNNVLNAQVSNLPTATDITITLQPSAYWTFAGPEDYVVRVRIDPPIVKILSVERVAAPK